MLIAGALLVLAAWLALVAAYAPRLRADWREPVLSAPVLIIESDDWGPGPAGDADCLRKIAEVLNEARDARGRPAVMTLGVVLAVPDGAESREGAIGYRPRFLDAPQFEAIRSAMLAGCKAGVFALQLHGREHFWPEALVKAAERDATARTFLLSGEGRMRHESLPPHLQARWIDASTLPSVPLDDAAIECAAADEIACFERIFGVPPRVAVPVTFTWTRQVEAAWARGGVRVVVTPGTRYVGRDRDGRLEGDGAILRNGDASSDAVTYVVRDVYFEPSLGHTAEGALTEIRERHRLGRPALLETHRFNFTPGPEQARPSLDELRRLLQASIRAIPGLRFTSTEALADALGSGDPALVDRSLAARLRALVLRAASHSRLRKLAWISGLALPALLVLATASLVCERPPAKGRT